MRPFWSGSMSTATLDSASGWQSGINSWVFLPARMPAMRAAPSTSPFLALPLSTSSSVAGAITTRPSATATRSVAAFDETSTMRASPLLARWVSLRARFTRLLRGAHAPLRRTEQRAGSAFHVGFAHQALAHQEGVDAAGPQLIEIARRENSTLRDPDAAGRDSRRQASRGRKRRLERPQVAVVDPDEARAKLERAVELALVMDFEQDIHAIGHGGRFEVLSHPIVHRRHDDQDAVGAPGSCFGDLVDLVHEVLAQDRQPGGGAGRTQVLGPALEGRSVGEHREARRAAGRVGTRKRRGVEVGADQALGRARLLDLSDQRKVAAGVLAFNRTNEPARRTGGLGLRLERGERQRTLCRCDLRALISFDLGEDVRHRRPHAFATARRRSSRPLASPESTDWCATATPCLRSFARPATTRAAAALRMATSRNGPGWPLSTSRSALAFSSASPPRSVSGLARASPTSSGTISKVRTAPSASAAT